MAGQASLPQSEVAPRRRWPRLLGGVLLVVLATGVGLWFARTALVEFFLVRALEEQGLGPVTLEVERADLSGMRIADIQAGSEGRVRATAIGLDYTLAGLRQGWVDRITITGPGLQAEVVEDTWVLRDLEPLFARDAEESGEPIPTLLPVGEVLVQAAELAVQTPYGQMTLAADGRLTGEGAGALHLDLEYELTAQNANLHARLIVDASPDQTFEARLVIEDGHVRHEQGSVSGLAGEVALAGTFDTVQRLSAELRFASLDALGTSLEPGRIGVRLTEQRLDAEADLAWEHGQVQFRTGGNPRIRPLAMLFSAAGWLDAEFLVSQLPGVWEGTGRVDFRVQGEVPEVLKSMTVDPAGPAASLATLLGTVLLEAQLESQLENLAAENLASAGRLAGRFRLVSTADALSVTAPEGVEIERLVLAPALLAGMPEAVRSAIVPGVVLNLGGGGRPSPEITLARQPFGLAVDVATGFSVTGREENLTGEIDMRVSLGPDEVPQSVTLTVSAAGRPLEGIAFADLGIEVAARLERRADSLRLDAITGGLHVSDANLGDELRGSVHFDLQGDANRVELDFTSGVLTHGLSLAPLEFDFIYHGADELELAVEAVVAGLGLKGKAPHSGTITLEGASFSLPGYDLAVDNAAGKAGWAGQVFSAELGVARIRHLAEPAWFAPVGARVDGELADETAVFSIRVSDPLGDLKLFVRGRHELEGNRGAADIVLEPLEFSPGVLQPADLVPVLGGQIERATGRFALDGRLAWTGDTLEPELQVTLDDIDATVTDVELTDVVGRFTLTGLDPPSTSPGQQLRFAVSGLREGERVPVDLAFQLRSDGLVAIESAQVRYAGGQLRAADALVDPDELTGEFELEVIAMDLAELMTIIDLEGLTGTGRLSGRVPLALAQGKLAVNAGTLAADGTGVLRYTGTELQSVLGERDDTVGLAVRALSDFRYRRLSMILDKDYDGEGNVSIRLEGSNPAVLEGYPFIFNINLATNFDRLNELLEQSLGAADRVLKMGIEGLGPQTPDPDPDNSRQ